MPYQKMVKLPKSEVFVMLVTRIRKGRYIAVNTRFEGKMILITYDPETRMWYAEDYYTGQSVVDCERHLYEIKERISE